MKTYDIGIVGAGNSAHALAAYLASKGHRISMYCRRPDALAHVLRDSHIRSQGKLEGVFPIERVVSDFRTLCKSSSIIFLATVATAYTDIIRSMAPFLTKDHVVIPFSSKLGGCKEVQAAFAAERRQAFRLNVLETDALFACRLQEDGSIWIRGIKNWNLYSGPTLTETKEYGVLLARLFDGLEPAENLIQRGLTDFGAAAHALITLANLSRIDRSDDFLFYYEGLSERTIVLLEAVEQEFRAVAEAYGTSLIPLKILLDRYYGCNTESLFKAVTSVPNYQHSKAPTSLNHRYFQEDVACTLVPLIELARKANVFTPIVDATVSIASTLGGRDFASEGRTLKRLGWSLLSHSEIMREVRS
jgi:opine dehydrogenase